jgi:hypothetical protein
MTAEELNRRLSSDHIIRLSTDEWDAVAPGLEEVERHDTFIAGDLILVRTDHGLAAVEEPKSGERVVRRLGDAATAAAFVKERLSDCERMWDGCGCKIDYYGRTDNEGGNGL